jgi:GMP synthase-like glutamine amidotransferase
MKVLIIDNRSAHLERLKSLVVEKLGSSRFKFCDAREIKDEAIEWADLVIISGGWGRSIIKNPGTFKRLVDSLANHSKPTIGICLGAEAIAAAYGAELVELPVRRVGNIRISITDKKLASALGKSDAMVYEFHKWYISQAAGPIRVMAASKDGIEVLRHKDLPIWGVQFHPEVKRLNNTGHIIFEYVLNELGLA